MPSPRSWRGTPPSVINGLTDLCRIPARLLADVSPCGRAGHLKGSGIAWVATAKHANSWIEAAQCAGFELRLGPVRSYDAEPRHLRARQAAGPAVITGSRRSSRRAHVVTPACGRPWARRRGRVAGRNAFGGYTGRSALMKLATEGHFSGLPARHRGEGGTAECDRRQTVARVGRGRDRLHVQKALLPRLSWVKGR